MNSREVIILAGGLGTRIKNISGGLPKCMLEIAGKPFIYHLIRQFLSLGAEKIILATAYKSKYIHEFVRLNFFLEVKESKIVFSEEKTPTGTGGAILAALSKVTSLECLVSNADTIIPNLSKNIWRPIPDGKNFMMFLSNMKGVRFQYFKTDGLEVCGVECNDATSGLTSSGLVLFKTNYLNQLNLSIPSSFDKDIILTELIYRTVEYQLVGGFIDFGIPEDFRRAQELYYSKENSIFS